jgi:hypothetical protein
VLIHDLGKLDRASVSIAELNDLAFRVRARPCFSKPISMPTLRRKVAARRNRFAKARGLSGQDFALVMRSPTVKLRAPRRSDAVPVHTVREVISVRTAAATGSASITPSIA